LPQRRDHRAVQQKLARARAVVQQTVPRRHPSVRDRDRALARSTDADLAETQLPVSFDIVSPIATVGSAIDLDYNTTAMPQQKQKIHTLTG